MNEFPGVQESFSQIKRYPNYWVTNLGRVYSLNRHCFLKQQIDSGYCRVNLYNSDGMKHFLVHRLVALYFISTNKKKIEVNHKDSNPLNNHVSNLEWVTPKENVIHSLKYGNRVPISGNDCSWSKLTSKDVKKIKRKYMKGIYGYDKLAKEFDVNRTTIANIILGISWRSIK